MAANRAVGAEARTISAQSVGLESKKTSGHGEVFFLDFPLYRTYQGLAMERSLICGAAQRMEVERDFLSDLS
jgi:hypothetical protein